MGYWAKLVSGRVVKVITAEASFFDNYVDDSPGTWVETFKDRSQRKNFAGIGYKYDGTGFYSPQPYDSWTLNSSTYLWEAPVAYPDDGNVYEWNESTQTWDTVE
mgnify:CR=1 FL=1